jgi:hypothetical protein
MSATTRDADAARGHLWPSSALRLAPVLKAELRLDTRNTAVRAGVLRRLLALGDILAALSAGFGGALAGGLGGVEILPFVALMVCGWALVAFAGGLYAADDLSSWASGIGECGRLGAMVLVLSWRAAPGFRVRMLRWPPRWSARSSCSSWRRPRGPSHAPSCTARPRCASER